MTQQPIILPGKSYTFDDGARIKIIQLKQGEEEIRVFYETTHLGTGIPRLLQLSMTEFISEYGHLFMIDR